MKRKKAAVWVTMVIAMALFVSACRKQSEGQDLSPVDKGQASTTSSGEDSWQADSRQPGNQQPKDQDNKGIQEQETEKFDRQADLEGSVYDFTETGFSLSPAETYEDGNGFVMAQGAPGAEDTSKLVTVTYSEDCIFQIVVMDLSSLKEVSREDTTSVSIKKQTQVKVYGSCQDTTHWTAESVIIVRWR